jgi:hypothetical protein
MEATGLWGVEDPKIGSQMAVRMSALLAGRDLPCRKIPGIHFRYRRSQIKGHSTAAFSLTKDSNVAFIS